MLKQFIEFCDSLDETEIDMWDYKACALALFGQHLHPGKRISAGAHHFDILDNYEVVQVLPYDRPGVMRLTKDLRRDDKYITGRHLAALLREEYSDVL